MIFARDSASTMLTYHKVYAWVDDAQLCLVTVEGLTGRHLSATQQQHNFEAIADVVITRLNCYEFAVHVLCKSSLRPVAIRFRADSWASMHRWVNGLLYLSKSPSTACSSSCLPVQRPQAERRSSCARVARAEL